MRVGEERGDGRGSEAVVLAGDDFLKVDEGRVLGLRDFSGPFAERAVAIDFAVLPFLARDDGAEDGRGAFGARRLNVLP